MMRHRQGSPYGVRPASLDVLEVHNAELRAESTSLLSIEAKVIDGELYMRVQQWATFTTMVPIHWPSWSALPYVTPGPDWLSICSHITRLHPIMPRLMECKQMHHRFDCVTCHKLLQCDKCCTEFEVEIRHLDMETEAVVITKWLNFGAGRDPQDPQWRCNLYGSGTGMIQKGQPRSGNRAVFEVVAERSCEVLTDDNAYVLERERFEWLFQRSESGRQVWTMRNYSILEHLLNQMDPSTNNTTAERLALLGLPAELGNWIFSLAVVAPDPLVARLAVQYTPGETPEQAMTRKTRAMPEIPAATQVNKQIRREILPIFYSLNHFLIPKEYFNKQTGAL
ncbi:tyrosine protein phosphatase 1 [Elasticomyces elasticus]|nr:tyrosine protein phosphatase 1 [Elasticomyces elasticus]